MSTRDDVEEFAALLLLLKDRTNRSYGSLARRLGMNTSTLHRYCAGEAVPQDFAPVERLAAFCGATPQERLELHRLWLSAAAARQRVRTAGTEEAPRTAGAAGTAEAPGTPEAAVPAPAADEAPDAAEALVTAGVLVTAEALVTGGDSAEQPGDDRGPTHPGPGPGSGLDGPGPGPGEPAPSPAPRPWYRRRRSLALSAVACALLATLGSTSVLSGDRTTAADTSRSTGSRTTVTGTAHRAAKPSAIASPSPSSSPSPFRSPARSLASPGARQRTPGASAPSAPSGTSPTSAVPRPPAGPPLTWSADSQVWEMGCGHDYVIGKPPAQVPPPPVQQDAGAWAATQGAVHGRQTMVRISVQGRTSTAVVLEALRVRVVSRGTPAAGNAYAMDQGCGGELTPRRFTVDLDVDRPTARPKDGADSEHTIPAVHFPYRVSAEDPESLLVDATTQTYDARWYLELDWSCQGRTGTLRIDDHGRPFHTTGIKGLPRYWYGTSETGERAWVPYGG
ncbi:helix-turn-helix domain-containing protein [Streptomyces sp. NPDC012751]|uniref:helix-turn-helix domain-containing protein n=1 Tax=Streptomyces sp. NPDC012751 TaxID=3364846 RepID=UPI0036CBA605